MQAKSRQEGNGVDEKILVKTADKAEGEESKHVEDTNGLREIKAMLERNERIASYRHHVGLVVAVWVGALGLAALPEVKFGVLSGYKVSCVLAILGLLAIIWAAIEYRPQYYRRNVAVVGSIMMCIGILTGVVVAVEPAWKVGGLLAFVVGFLVVSFSKVRVRVGSEGH